MTYDPLDEGLYVWETHAEADARRRAALDPLRAPETDEEPWLPTDPQLDHRGPSLLDGAVVATGWWVYLTFATVGALAAVLVAIGLWRVLFPESKERR